MSCGEIHLDYDDGRCEAELASRCEQHAEHGRSSKGTTTTICPMAPGERSVKLNNILTPCRFSACVAFLLTYRECIVNVS